VEVNHEKYDYEFKKEVEDVRRKKIYSEY